MNRYVIYLVVLNMLANVVAFVPKILLKDRFNGSVMALGISTLIGVVIIYIFSFLLSKFPNKGFPEILKQYTPVWLTYPLLVAFLGMWFMSGFLTLSTFTDIAQRYINPESNVYIIIGTLLAVVIFGALMKSDKVLYALEITILLMFPVAIFIFFKSFSSEYLDLDAMRAVATYVYKLPSFQMVSAAFYTYAGFSNMAIFNRLVDAKVSWKYVVLIGCVGSGNLLTSFFIPIGLNGIDAIDDYVFPWLIAADSLRMEYAFVERVLYLFLLFYLGISLISVTVHWHVALEIGKELIISEKFKWKDKNLVPYLILLLFLAATLVGVKMLAEWELVKIAQIWLDLLIPAHVLALLILLWIVWRSGKWKSEQRTS